MYNNYTNDIQKIHFTLKYSNHCSYTIYRNYEITYTVLLQRVLALYTLGHVQYDSLRA